ncbi:MAG: TnsA endonuclease N-terminal domain-containing protein [Candidatus Hodarchaeota archaeon]
MAFTSIKYIDNKTSTTFDFVRPQKTREIEYTVRSDRGYIPSLKKYQGYPENTFVGELSVNKNILEYESWIEHDFYLLLDHDPHCIDIQTQPIELTYKTASGRIENFYPDVWVLFLTPKGLKHYLFEVKPESDLALLVNNEDWQRKQQTVREFCQSKNWQYQIITERKIKCTRLDNVKNCLLAAKHFSLVDFLESKEVKGFVKRLRKIIIEKEKENESTNIQHIARVLDLFYSNISLEEIISLLKYMIYFQQIFIEWNVPFEAANLSLKKIPITPVFALPDVELSLEVQEELRYTVQSPKKSYVMLSGDELEKIYGLISKYGTTATQSQIKKFAKHSKYTLMEIKDLYLSWKNEQKFQARKKLIAPVVERFDTSGKKKGIYQFLQGELKKTKSEATKIYKLYNDYKREGDIGLYPERGSSHSKSRFHPLVEEYFTYYVNLWHKKGGQIKSRYDAFIENWTHDVESGKIDLQEILDDLNRGKEKKKQLTEKDTDKLLPTYMSFYKRTKKLPFHETLRKDDMRGGESIKKGRRDVFREGLYPGYFIQVDHTKADIWVVDELTGEAYVRPWLTNAVDVYSHGVWGFYVTDWEHPNDAPDQETVMNCILNGILPKKSLPEWRKFEFATALKRGLNPEAFDWPTAGIPAIIQVDNSKEFMAKSVLELCMKLNITLDFRPVKLPAWGGFVESFWDVINNEIRNRELPGRVYPIQKERRVKKKVMFKKPPNYDPQEDASWTLEEFREWFIAYLITVIQHRPRGGELESPNDIWKHGMQGTNYHVCGGVLRLPPSHEYEKFEYETKISQSAVFSDKGVRYSNMYYTSEWLREARRKRILPDGKSITFKVSKWDRRYVWIKDPELGKIEVLEAYNYAKDRRIQRLLDESLGKIQGKAPFPLSQKLIDYVEDVLEEISTAEGGVNLLLHAMTKEFSKRGRIRKKTRKKLNLFFREARKNPTQIETILKALAGQKVSIDLLEEAGIELEETEADQFLLLSTPGSKEVISIEEEKGVESQDIFLQIDTLIVPPKPKQEEEEEEEEITLTDVKKKQKDKEEKEEEEEYRLPKPKILPTSDKRP